MFTTILLISNGQSLTLLLCPLEKFAHAKCLWQETKQNAGENKYMQNENAS